MHLHKDTFVLQPPFGWSPLYVSSYFISSDFAASRREFLSVSGALCSTRRCLENIARLTDSPLLESRKARDKGPSTPSLLQHPSWLMEHCTVSKYWLEDYIVAYTPGTFPAGSAQAILDKKSKLSSCSFPWMWFRQPVFDKDLPFRYLVPMSRPMDIDRKMNSNYWIIKFNFFFACFMR